MAKDLHSILAGKWTDGTRPKDLYARLVAKKPEAYVGAIVEGLGAEKKRIQGGCAELASLLSADHPKLLCRHVDLFLANLAAKEPILRWEAACTVGNLAAVDAKKRIPERIEVLASLLDHESIVLQGHAARALGKVGRSFPDLAPRILDALFSRIDRFPGTRVGYVIEAAGLLAEVPALTAEVRERVEPFAQSKLGPVATKAKRILRMLETHRPRLRCRRG